MKKRPIRRSIDEWIDHLVSVAQDVTAAYHWDSGLAKAREALVATKNSLRLAIKNITKKDKKD